MERRLAAILAADVVGYSRMMGTDEAGTLARLSRLRAERIEPVIASHRGRVVKLMGDGILVEFASVVDALTCAVAWQEALVARETEGGPPLRFRIGVNIGDIIFTDDGDIHGNGVNVAARLESLAEAGGICVSGAVFAEVKHKLDVIFEDMGPQRVKNIAEPIDVFRVRAAAAKVAEEGAASPAGDSAPGAWTRPAVAVLPFDNMSRDPEQEYFSDGLTEDIITALSHWRSFPVIARNSSFTYKGQAVRVQQVGQELGARYVLEGSVRKAGNRLRITAQLIDAKSGHHVWAERFDRQLEDIFDVQDEITTRIAATIMPELESFEHKKAASKPTSDLSAWDYYLKGMETFHAETCDGTQAALRMFQAAVERDPNYCDAWARVGWCLAKLVMFDCPCDHGACLQKGFAAGRRAVDLDDSSALAHIALGTVHIWAGETEQGLAEAQMAAELNPNFAHARMAAGNRMDLVGRGEEGIAEMERALKLNPRDPIRWRYMAYLSRAYVSLGQVEAAAAWARQAARLRPDLPEAAFRGAICLAHLDDATEARALLRRCQELNPDYLAKKSDWRPYPDQARNDHLLSGLRRHGLLPPAA